MATIKNRLKHLNMKSDLLSRLHVAMLLRMLCLAGICLGLGAANGLNQKTAKPVVLFDAGDFPNGWSYFSAKENGKIEDTWKVIDAQDDKTDDVLICLGKPFGYIRTKDKFQDFDFQLEWKFPQDANGNSGILIHTMDGDKIWPKSIQVQLHQPAVGSIFPSGGAKTANTLTVKDQKLPVNQWHKLRVLSETGRLVVFVNDKKFGEVTGCEPKAGNIALQSEGSEVHFRRIRLMDLTKPTEKPVDEKQPPKPPVAGQDKQADDAQPALQNKPALQK